MPYTPKPLLSPFPAALTTSPVTLYTVPASTTAIVKQIAVSNYSAAAAALSLHLLPSGGSPAVQNRFIAGMSVPPSETLFFDLTQVLLTGGFVSASASANSALLVWVSGVEIT